ncbi:MAG: ABC transporter permease [Chitinophagales bacterium]|nr:ABC transporter permease [Chitinophagales bacterium]
MNREQHTVVYNSKPPSIPIYLKSVYENRHFLLLLSWQEIKAQYAQTYFGLLWALIRPLLLIIIFTLVFKKMLHVATDSPYYLFAFVGMISWNYFYGISVQASHVMQQRRDLFRKFNMPKLILPLYKSCVVSVDMLTGLVLVMILVVYEGLPIQSGLFLLPVFLIANLFCGLMVAIWANCLSIRFRDINHLLPALIGVGFWVTPIFYPSTMIPSNFSYLLYINPMAGVLAGLRYSILGEPFPTWPYFVSLSAVAMLTFLGVWYLSRIESEIADYA